MKLGMGMAAAAVAMCVSVGAAKAAEGDQVVASFDRVMVDTRPAQQAAAEQVREWEALLAGKQTGPEVYLAANPHQRAKASE